MKHFLHKTFNYHKVKRRGASKKQTDQRVERPTKGPACLLPSGRVVAVARKNTREGSANILQCRDMMLAPKAFLLMLAPQAQSISWFFANTI